MHAFQGTDRPGSGGSRGGAVTPLPAPAVGRLYKGRTGLRPQSAGPVVAGQMQLPGMNGAPTMRAELIGHFKPCMTEIYLHIDARMADYIRTHRA